MVGIPATKGEIDSRMGELARKFQGAFSDAQVLKSYFDSTIDTDLMALGYTANDVAVLKSAMADINQLFLIYSGVEGLAAPKDFTTFLRQLWGVGVP